VVILAAVASQAGGAASPSVAVGKPFTLASPPTGAPGIGPVGVQVSALGSDGTLWAAVTGTPSEAVVVVAHAADGRTLGPLNLTVPGGFGVGTPVISVSGATATFAWLAYDVKYHTHVEARTCTLSGCRPTQTVESWQAIRSAAPVLAGGSPIGLASTNGRTILVFYRNSGTAQMMWAQSSGGPFGPVRAIAAPPLESNVAIDIPVAIAESGGRVLALWPLYGPTSMVGVSWTIWSAPTGFAPAQALTGARGIYSDDTPVAAAVGAGAAIAWIQGNDNSEDQPAEPIWISRQTASGFTTPAVTYGGLASGPRLAGGGGVLALAFTDDDDDAVVERSVAGAPFTPPVRLMPSAASSPAVSVDARGETLAAWAHETNNLSGVATTQLAIAPAGGTFSHSRTLAPASHTGLVGTAPTVDTSANRSAVIWVGASGSARGAFATP
jgi:hypothetical protein